MGRRDLTEQRTGEILDAFERCVARFGLAGSSLEMVAQEAEMKRSILRHYVGNREDLIEALAKRVMSKYRVQIDWLLENLPNKNRINALLDYLFPKKNPEAVQSMLVVEALIAASNEYPICQKMVSEYIDYLTKSICNELQETRPKSASKQCWTIAYGIVGLCFNNESLVPLDLPSKYAKASRDCAERLIATLE